MSRSDTLAVGAAKIDVSPPPNPRGTLDVPILGFWWERAKAYREVHDPLSARAVVFRARGDTVAVVSLDLIGDAIGLGAEAKARAAMELGLAPECVMIASTHAHTTPETIDLCGRKPAASWREHVVTGVVEALRQALTARRPAVLRTASGPLTGVSVNRRAGPCGPEYGPRGVDLDTELRVARAETPDGTPLATLINFACHPVAVQTQPLISADYPGHAMAELERDGRHGPVCLFTNGSTGDVNPARKDGFEDVTWTGDRLAAAVRDLSTQDRRDRPVEHDRPLAAASRTIRLPRRALPSRDELAEQRKRLEGQELFTVNETLALHDRPETIEAEVQVLRIGDWLLAGVPGELFTCLGRDIREAGRPRPTWVVGYANGYVGYIAPAEAHAMGGYEVSRGRWSPLAAGAGETIRNMAVELIGTATSGI